MVKNKSNIAEMGPKSPKSILWSLCKVRYIFNGYEWLDVIRTDIQLWFVTCFRMFEGLLCGKLVRNQSNIAKIWPKSPKSSLRSLCLSRYISNGNEWWDQVKTDIPEWFLTSFSLFGSLQGDIIVKKSQILLK